MTCVSDLDSKFWILFIAAVLILWFHGRGFITSLKNGFIPLHYTGGIHRKDNPIMFFIHIAMIAFVLMISIAVILLRLKVLFECFI